MEYLQVGTLIAAFVAAFAAIRSYGEARELRKDAEIPVISFRFRQVKVEPTDPIYDAVFENHNELAKTPFERGESVPVFSYRLVNVGAGPAMNLSLEVKNMEGTTRGTMKGYMQIDDIIGAKVPPDLEVCFATSRINDNNCLRKKETWLVVKYKDIYGRKYETHFVEGNHKFFGPAISSINLSLNI